MIAPTLGVMLYTRDGYDKHGQTTFSAGRPAKCAPVKLAFAATHTTVRTDSSGSHGSASENTADVVVLFKPEVVLAVDDEMHVLGRRVKITVVHPRFTVAGKHDHNQVTCVQA